MMILSKKYYNTLLDILNVLGLSTNDTLATLISKTQSLGLTLENATVAEKFYTDYLKPRTLYESWVITSDELTTKNNKIDNIEVLDFFNGFVSKLNSLTTTYAPLIDEYNKGINELIKNGAAVSTIKTQLNDTPESVQTDKYDEKYASQTTKQETTIQDNSGMLLAKLNNYQENIKNIYELFYSEIEKLLVGDFYELWQNKRLCIFFVC